MATAEDIASDKRFFLTIAVLFALQVALGVIADAGLIPIWLWAVLAVAAIGVTALGSIAVGRRSGRGSDR